MDEKNPKQTEMIEIDLRKLWKALVSKVWVLICVSVLCAALALIGTVAFVAPRYQSTATFFVNNGSLTGTTTGQYNASDISASRGLVDTYIEILTTRETLQQVAEYLNREDITWATVSGMVTASAVEDTELFRIAVTYTDPQVAYDVARAITNIFPDRIADIIKNATVKTVDNPVLNTSPVSPNRQTNTLIGFVIGLVLAALGIILREMMDVTVRSTEDIKRACDCMVLATVPDMQDSTRSGKSRQVPGTGETGQVGDRIGFAAAEAYKLLRTKLQYSFADEKNCYIIGITSVSSGEGKSLTAVNLAYSLAQLGKSVMLVDCDMRRPSISTKLGISRFPGLSNYLVKQSQLEEVIHTDAFPNDDVKLQVITSGKQPPNPVELLSSPRMIGLLEQLRERCDYVILDLPPTGEVSDALAVSSMVDGMLMVVRQNICEKKALNTAVNQLKFVNSRILGVVYNGAVEPGKSGNYKYYGYGNSKNDRGYSGRYAAKPTEKPAQTQERK